jgi:hypothetical protein
MLLASLLLIAAPAPAATPAPAPAAKKASQSPDKVVCRTETETYSRIPTRICRTQKERDELAKQTENDLANSRNDRAIAPN